MRPNDPTKLAINPKKRLERYEDQNGATNESQNRKKNMSQKNTRSCAQITHRKTQNQFRAMRNNHLFFIIRPRKKKL